MPLVVRNDLLTCGLIGHHAGMIVLGIELLREGRGPHQVNELYCQLTPLAVSGSSVYGLESRVRRSRGFRRFALRCSAHPHQHLTVFICRDTFSFDEFGFEVFQIFVIQIETPLQRTIGYAAFAL